jgi:NAD-dependent dihydropyrimidine dehydrogenase PreA subunit
MFRFVKKIGQARGHIENDLSKCVYCGVCQKSCLHKAITVDPHTRQWIYDEDACFRCKACTLRCPKKSLSLVKLK